jgi:hypothetical protein
VNRPRLLPHRLLALFAAGVLLFNFPLLKLWLADATVGGLPLLPLALFGAWALLIGGLAWVLERRGDRSDHSSDHSSGHHGE